MRVAVTGGAGFLGRLLVDQLDTRPDVGRVTTIDRAGEVDIVGDVTDAAAVAAALDGADAIVHLASMVSAECEVDFDAALDVNLRGLLTVLDAARASGAAPRFLFVSSIAVFGAAADAGDHTKQTPASTYGVTKAIGELLVNEYTRKGFVDGRCARLPTVIVRPGKPNQAASSFASGLFREPLRGLDTVVPVPLRTRMCVIGHRSAVGGLVGLLTIDSARLGADRSVALPGLAVTVAEMIDALGRAGGQAALDRVVLAPDPAVEAVVASWPGSLDPRAALALGLPADASLDSVVADHLADFGR